MGKQAGTIFLFLMSCTSLVFVGPFCSGEPPAKQKGKGEDLPSTTGVNVTDKDGVLFINGTNAKKLCLTSKRSAICLSKFEIILNKNGLTGEPYNGLCFFVELKNNTNFVLLTNLIEKNSESRKGLFNAIEAPNKKLKSAFTNTVLYANGFPYREYGQLRMVPALDVYRDDVVFYTIDLEAEKVLMSVALSQEEKPVEFYVLLKDLKTTNSEKRDKDYIIFIGDKSAK